MIQSVMIVASHASFRQDLAAYLAMLDSRYRVIASVSHAAEAFERLAVAQPDLVLLDIDIPGENGVEALRRMHRTWPSLPIIALGGDAAADYRAAIREAGGRGYIDKLELVATLPAHLARVHATPPPEGHGATAEGDPA